MSTHVEAEVKYKISAEEYAQLTKLLVSLGFVNQGVVMQEDYHIAHNTSPFGGMDFQRIRKTTPLSGVSEYSWDKKSNSVDAHGNKVRLEDSRPSSEEEYNQLLSGAPTDSPRVMKRRHNFVGTIGTWSATISVDAVDFGAGDSYFVEAEIITDLEHGVEAKELCKQWLAENLDIDITTEAPGYLKQFFASRPMAG